MSFQITVSCGPSEIVSRGRRVCRCYRRVNQAPAFGRETGQLACIGCQAVRKDGGGIDYLVTLADVDELTDPRATNGEASDFSPLTPEWTLATALPQDPLPQLAWSPSTPEGQV
jgi:hypothetical protein